MYRRVGRAESSCYGCAQMFAVGFGAVAAPALVLEPLAAAPTLTTAAICWPIATLILAITVRSDLTPPITCFVSMQGQLTHSCHRAGNLTGFYLVAIRTAQTLVGFLGSGTEFRIYHSALGRGSGILRQQRCEHR